MTRGSLLGVGQRDAALVLLDDPEDLLGGTEVDGARSSRLSIDPSVDGGVVVGVASDPLTFEVDHDDTSDYKYIASSVYRPMDVDTTQLR